MKNELSRAMASADVKVRYDSHDCESGSTEILLSGI